MILDVALQWHLAPELPDEHRIVLVTVRYENPELGTGLEVGRRSGGLWYVRGESFARESRFGLRIAAWAYCSPLPLDELEMLARARQRGDALLSFPGRAARPEVEDGQ
jgi:hypothetical protein